MPFSLYRTSWQLRPEVQVPFAHREEEPETLTAPAAASAQPAVPVQPAPPTQSAAPTQPATPMQPVAPAQPAASVQPAAPIQPAPPAVKETAGGSAGRGRRAVYISVNLRLSYLPGLKNYLGRQGVAAVDFSAADRPAPLSVVLLAPGELPPPGCLCFLPDENKALLWSFLKKQLQEPAHV